MEKTKISNHEELNATIQQIEHILRQGAIREALTEAAELGAKQAMKVIDNSPIN